MIPLMEKAKGTAEGIKKRFGFEAEIGVVLGSGYPIPVKDDEVVARLPYGELSFFPGDIGGIAEGGLLLADVSGKYVVIFSKRLHYYQGLALISTCYPVFLARFLGAGTILLTNTAGALSPSLDPGDLMLISDHINLLGDPLLEVPFKLRNPLFPDLSSCYTPSLIELGGRLLSELKLRVKSGVLVAVSGPCYETPADVKRLRVMGGDAVCMSTAPEAIIGCYLKMKVAGLSLISNRAGCLSLSHDDVLKCVREKKDIILKFIRGFIARCRK
jgi:purine-nucleoside phosphorylase